MTVMSSIFSSYCVSYSRDKVHVANGSFPLVAGTGYIPLTSSLPLSFVFHSPNFKLNLVSVSHIIKVLNCSVSFPLIILFKT